jgi:uncharacterized membrane protein
MVDFIHSEIYPALASLLIFLLYHAHLIYQVRRHPLTTSIGVTNHLRGHWVESVMRDNRDILAVQTLRNWVMSSSFLASTAILISLGFVNLAASPEKIGEISPGLQMMAREHQALWLFKMMGLILDFFFIFFNFCLAIRYYNHVNFMINVPSTLAHKITPDYITGILNRGMAHYTLGMRGYYVAVLLILGLFGAIWMFFGTVILLCFLFYLDRHA